MYQDPSGAVPGKEHSKCCSRDRYRSEAVQELASRSLVRHSRSANGPELPGAAVGPRGRQHVPLARRCSCERQPLDLLTRREAAVTYATPPETPSAEMSNTHSASALVHAVHRKLQCDFQYADRRSLFPGSCSRQTYPRANARSNSHLAFLALQRRQALLLR